MIWKGQNQPYLDGYMFSHGPVLTFSDSLKVDDREFLIFLILVPRFCELYTFTSAMGKGKNRQAQPNTISELADQ